MGALFLHLACQGLAICPSVLRHSRHLISVHLILKKHVQETHVSSEIRPMLDMVSLAWQKKIEYKDHSAYDAAEYCIWCSRVEYLLMQTWKLQTLMNITIISRGMISVPWKSKGLDLVVVELY